jgi:hypothetical protein
MASESDKKVLSKAGTLSAQPVGPRPSARRPARQTPVRATQKLTFALLLERAAPWKNLILICGVGLPILIASRIGPARPVEAVILALVLPVVLVGMAWSALRDARHRGLLVAFTVVGLAAVVVAEAEIAESFFPGAPFGGADLSVRSADQEIRVPAGVQDFRVEVDSPRLAAMSGEARGRYELELRRGGQTQTVAGELSREVRTARAMMRRGAPTRSVLLHDADIRDVQLRGSGPVTAHLVSAEGIVESGVRVELRKASGADRLLVYALAALALVALGLEIVAARLQHRTALAASIAVLGVFAYHVAHRFNPSDPLGTVMGGAIFALLTGGLGGWLVGAGAASFVKRAAPAADEAAR